MAEVLINDLAQGEFQAYSAGSHPAGEVNPHALSLLRDKGFDLAGLRSKNWDEFAQEGAPELDFVITVCDNAAGEVCPIWPGSPMNAHWGIADPAAVTGSDGEKREAFQLAFNRLTRRIRAFLDLPLNDMNLDEIQSSLNQIGEFRGRGK